MAGNTENKTNNTSRGAAGRSTASKSGGTRAGSTGRSKKNLEEEMRRQREEALKRSMRRRHITSVILFAVGILLTLAAVIPAGEGEGWRGFFDIMHGLFGYSAFAVGPLMIFIAIQVSASRDPKKLGGTVAKCCVGILMLCAAVQIFFVGSTPGESLFDVIGQLYVYGKEFRGGGVFALFIGGLLLLLGRLGATIIMVILILVCILLFTGISVADFTRRVADPVKKAGEKAKEHHERVKEDNKIAAEEFQLDQQELERIQAEIDAEQEDKRSVAELKKAVFSVSEPEPAAESPVEDSAPAVPESDTAAQQSEPPVEESPEDSAAEENLIEEQHEDNEDYMSELKNYIMEKNRAVIEESERLEKDPLEDEDAELVPIIDALHRFREEEPVQIKKVEDLPEDSVTTSDEGELPFDIDDVIDEPECIPAPQKPEIVEVPRPGMTERPAEAPRPTAPEPAKPVQSAQIPTGAPAQKQAADGSMQDITLSDVYTLPPVNLLNPVQKKVTQADIDSEIERNSKKLVEALQSFGVQTKLVGVSRGPSVTRYELQPAPGVKISRITGLVDDIALNLASAGVRIEAPIPNKSAVGIEVPNKVRDTVFFRELIDTPEFRGSFSKKLETVLGKDISGAMVTCNIAKMPHLLIAGTTGSGKSVCVNSIIMSILMKSTPDDVRLIMVDPKKVEFMMYNGIPHLLIPVVTDPKKAAGALAWAVNEMLNRYKMFSENNVRDFTGFNELAADPDSGLTKMSHIVIFIDELADLMMASPKDVEDSIVRLAQMARAAGMHLVIATQRPTVNVVTGLIKANIPSRIALMVASQMDSRVILDAGGAEKLLGNGDMLYMPVGLPKPVRVQGCFVSDKWSMSWSSSSRPSRRNTTRIS